MLARTRGPVTGRSVLAGRRTTCLPKYLERLACLARVWRLGRYLPDLSRSPAHLLVNHPAYPQAVGS
jgi:hypothetical protein